MTQTNVGTGKSRAIRVPHGWKAPSKQLVPQGKTVCLTIRPSATKSTSTTSGA